MVYSPPAEKVFELFKLFLLFDHQGVEIFGLVEFHLFVHLPFSLASAQLILPGHPDR
jgi:hypothetical protein